MQKMPMPALINLRSHPDEGTRRRGYEAENVAWEAVKETLAACLNGIKGEANTLNKRRGRKDAVHASLDAARIDRTTLEAMLEAMRDSFPMFRRYFKAKARKLGKEQLAWWDISAPMGKSDKTYSFEEARDFILDNFGKFSPDLRAFAKRAFDNRWIDAEQRDGKRGGAFCMGVAGVEGKPRPVQLRRLLRSGEHDGARAGSRLPQRVRVLGRQDRTAADARR